MKGIIRNSGIDIIGKIPWGTHFCQFYKTKEDLIDVLVPYLKSGLENNEFCMWVTSEPLSAEEAKRSLGREIPNLDYYLEKGQIEIISYTEWYVIEGDFDSDRVLNGWVSKLNQALKDGYEGLRLTGNTFWLEKEGWNDFVEYEEAVDNVIGKYQMIALCTYSLDRCTAAEIIDVINNHEFALIKREGKWDIIENSEHKQTKEEAIQSKKNWEQTFNAVPDLIAILDHEHKVVRVNKAMAAKLGLDPDECVGLHCYQAVHGTDEPPYFCPHSQLLKDGCEHTSEVHEDNLGGDFIVSASPLYNSAEELMGSVHVARNINERKKAEEALKEAHDNLEEQVNERTSKLKKQADLIDLTHDAIFVRNLDDEIIFWNKGAEEMYGWKEESALGINPNELLNTEFSKPLSEIKAVVLEKGRWEGELTHEKRDGKQIIVSSRWSLQKDEKNEVTGFLEINNDITETKQAEQALKLASTYNRSLIEASVDPLVTIGPDGKITDVNGSTETITGYSRLHLIGTDFSDYFTEPEKAREGYQQVFKEGMVLDYPLEIQHRDGFITPVLYNASVYRDEDDEVIGVFAAARDVTELRKAEKELKLSYIYNRSLIEASVDPLVTIGPDGKITDVNNSTEIVTGRPREELIGTDFSDYFTEPEKAREGYTRVFQEGMVLDYPLEIMHKNGHITPVLYNASVYKDESGKVIGVFAAARDINELKKAEEELRLSYIYNRSLIEASIDPLVTIGPDGKITDVNKSTEKVTGFNRDELIGTDFSDYFTEPEKAREGYQLVFQEGTVQDYPLEIKHKSGIVTPVLYNASIYRNEDGEVIGVFAAARDITERKLAEAEKQKLLEQEQQLAEELKASNEELQATTEELQVTNEELEKQRDELITLNKALKENERLLKLSNIYNRSLIEASIDPLVTIGPNGKITDVNDSTEDVTGYSRDHLIGTDFSDYFTEPDKARKGYQLVFEKGKVIDYPLEIHHRNGDITPVLYNASVYSDENGKVIGVFAAARDITELKKAEELLKLKINELARSNAELEQFAYVSSHDLQEPLRMIASYLQLLERKYEGKLDKKADKYIHFAVDGATRMQNLIDDLLTFSRVTTQANEFELTDIEVILNRVLTNLSVSIKENSATITHGTLPEIMVDGTQMTQVLQNLINNALKFRSKDNPKIHISASQEDKYWLFSVKDNGIGIDPKYSERIFEVFKRLHKKRDYPGTGIGLSICKKIVERHGGRIWVDSKLGEGSTFYFNIPVSNFDEEEYNET
jgi:PAS domain S-box-containing protein